MLGRVSLERIAVVLLALGSSIALFVKVLNQGAPTLPLKVRQEIVERDRKFLEDATPLEQRAAAENAGVLAPFDSRKNPELNPGGPGISAVVGDKCSGKDCKVVSVQTSPIATASLPTCNAGTMGMLRMSTNGGGDGGATTFQCNGSSWEAVGSGVAGSSTDTCTGAGPCLIGYGGVTTDGGFISAFPVGQGGVAFQMEAGNYLMLNSGNTVRINSPNDGTASLSLYVGGVARATLSGATGRFGATLGLDSSADVLAGTNTTATTYLRSIGVATGSLPTCDASLKGAIETDTTLSCPKFCNGSAWSNCLVSAANAINNYWSAMCLGACGNDTNFTGGIYSLGGAVTRMTCSWATAGTGGTTGVVIKVRNVTGSSDLCSCTVGACTIAANTPTACTCSGTFTAASLYTMRLSSSTDCGANPQNIICTASVIP
jgi:hypothetical protein